MPSIQTSTPIVPQQSAPKVTTLDKGVNAVKAATQDGTFIGDNLLVVGAGSLIGATATLSGVAKVADKVPAVEKALEFTFVQNGKLVGGAASLATSAILAEDALASYQEGDHGKAAAEGAGALITGLGGVEFVGRQFDIPVARRALSVPVEKAVKHSQAIGGTALVAGGAAAIKSGIDDLREGHSVLGGAKLIGGSAAVLGGTEMVGRRYNIPVAKELLSTPAEWVGNNIKAVTGAAAIAGGAAAIAKGVSDVKDGKTLQGSAEIAGGAIGALGGAELVGRQYDIPVLKEALTGTAKAIFTSKGGMIASGSTVALTGVAAAADGVRRLTTEKGLVNDAIGVAEITAGVAAGTGGAAIVGVATQNAKLAGAFTDNLPILGGVALIGTAASLGKFTAQDIKENGFEITHVATGTGAALAAMGGTQMIASKLGIPMLDKAFDKGWEPIAAVGLGAAAYKLGEVTVDQGKQMIADPSLGKGLITAGAAAGTALVGAGSVAVAGRALNVPGMEKAGMFVLNGTKNTVVKSAEFVGEKVAKPVFEFAVKNPAVTLGALAVAAGTGYYFYQQNKAEAAK
ncbi:MAG: hypothetical protein ACO1RX_17290 [Candidatus Sericytochromatia bacterium]